MLFRSDCRSCKTKGLEGSSKRKFVFVGGFYPFGDIVEATSYSYDDDAGDDDGDVDGDGCDKGIYDRFGSCHGVGAKFFDKSCDEAIGEVQSPWEDEAYSNGGDNF